MQVSFYTSTLCFLDELEKKELATQPIVCHALPNIEMELDAPGPDVPAAELSSNDDE